MMSRQKIQLFSENGKVLCSGSRSNSVKIKERNASRNKHMSPETRDFIQKICYRKTASIDMTQHGFINDSKVDPVNYVMKPLRAQLKKIRVKPAAIAVKRDVRNHYSPGLPRGKLREDVTSIEKRPRCVSKSVKHAVLPGTKPREGDTWTERKPPCIPKSALSCPGTRSSRIRRRVRIQSEPNPSPEVEQNKVEVMSPKKNKARTSSRKK